jgi:hypothetical protein
MCFYIKMSILRAGYDTAACVYLQVSCPVPVPLHI